MTMNGFSTGEDDSRGASDQICCLVDENDRCKRPAGNASYSKRIQKTVTQRRLKLRIDNLARHIYICDFHKTVIQTARTKRRRKDSEDDSNEQDIDIPEIDLNQLQLNTLKRYKKHYKIPSKPTMNKTQLAELGLILRSRAGVMIIFHTDFNETLENDTCSGEGNINIFHIHGKIKQQQIRSEKWRRRKYVALHFIHRCIPV